MLNCRLEFNFIVCKQSWESVLANAIKYRFKNLVFSSFLDTSEFRLDPELLDDLTLSLLLVGRRRNHQRETVNAHSMQIFLVLDFHKETKFFNKVRVGSKLDAIFSLGLH